MSEKTVDEQWRKNYVEWLQLEIKYQSQDGDEVSDADVDRWRELIWLLINVPAMHLSKESMRHRVELMRAYLEDKLDGEERVVVALGLLEADLIMMANCLEKQELLNVDLVKRMQRSG